jgi:hypothetical protein
MFDLSSVLKDKTKFADDLEVQVGDQKVTLGDVRAWDLANAGAVQRSLEADRKALDVERAKVQKAADTVTQMYVQMEDERKKMLTNPPAREAKNTDPLADYDDDPVIGPLAKYLKSANQTVLDRLDKLENEKLATINKSLVDMGTTYMTDRAAREFDELMSREDPVKPKDLSLESLYKYAVDNNIRDARTKIPSIKNAYDQMTAPQRHEHQLKEAREQGRKDAMEESRRAAILPRPTGPVGQVGKGSAAKDLPKNLDQAIAKAAEDVAIWSGGNA